MKEFMYTAVKEEYSMQHRLTLVRERMGMNKRQFAEHLGIKYTTYLSYENGVNDLNTAFLTLVSQRCDTSVDYLLGLTNEDRPFFGATVASFDGDPLELLSEDERSVVKAFRSADNRSRADALRLLEWHRC